MHKFNACLRHLESKYMSLIFFIKCTKLCLGDCVKFPVRSNGIIWLNFKSFLQISMYSFNCTQLCLQWNSLANISQLQQGAVFDCPQKIQKLKKTLLASHIWTNTYADVIVPFSPCIQTIGCRPLGKWIYALFVTSFIQPFYLSFTSTALVLTGFMTCSFIKGVQKMTSFLGNETRAPKHDFLLDHFPLFSVQKNIANENIFTE